MDELGLLRPHGIFLRREALAYGWNDRDLRHALGSGAIKRVRHGAYVAAELWERANASGRHCLLTHATLLTQDAGFAASHTSAALLHELLVWDVDLSRVHLTRTAAGGGRRHRQVSYHEGPDPADLTNIQGTSVVGVATAAVGTAMVSSVEAGVVVVDSAYHHGQCTESDLRTVVGQMENWPGSARLQITMRIAQAGSESVGESRARVLFARNRVPRPKLQFHVYDGTKLVGVTDFAWPEHGVLGEFDGKVKYDELRRPGETAADVLFREKQREDRIRELTGWRFIRLTWPDLGRPQQTSARVRQILGV